MKKIGLFIAITILLMSCGKKEVRVEVSNTSNSDRSNEIISIPGNDLGQKLTLTEGKQIVITNEDGEQVPYQLINNESETVQDIIFPVTVAAGKKCVYTIKEGIPEQFIKKTFGRAVPERKDDFAWENDRIAFRMYGPALAPENPSNGVDVWLKKTNDLIVDKFYKDDLENGLSYHIDHGLGLDCYKVGHTLGGGGIAPFFEDSLWIGGPYSGARILDSGVLRTSFELRYDSVPFRDRKITQKIIITLDAFSQLNKAVVSYEGDFDTFEVAGGIWLHSEIGNMASKPESGYIAYSENASDSKVPAGRTYIGVVFPNGMKSAIQKNDHLIGLADYKKGEQFTYYFGAGWSEWGFDSDEAWFKYVDNFASNLKQPLNVSIIQ